MPKTKASPSQQNTPVADAVIGDRVRYRRNLVKMSQKELGGKIGTSFQQIQKYEKGINRISGSRLLQIAEALGCSLEDLLGNTTRATPDKSTRFTKFAASKHGIAIIEAMSEIPSAEMRRRIIQIAKAIARSTPRR